MKDSELRIDPQVLRPRFARSAKLGSIAGAALLAAGLLSRSELAHAGPTLGLAVGAYKDSGEKEQRLTLGGPEDVERTEFENNGLFNLSAWMLFPVWFEHFRAGGGVRWYGTYGTKNPDADNEQEEDLYKYGSMFQFYGQAEYGVQVGKPELLFGVQGGLLTIFPGRDFREEIDADARAGWNNTSLPRLGLFVGPLLGVRYPFAERFFARGDLGLQFARAWLLDSEGADNSAQNKQQQLVFTRFLFNLGIEADL